MDSAALEEGLIEVEDDREAKKALVVSSGLAMVKDVVEFLKEPTTDLESILSNLGQGMAQSMAMAKDFGANIIGLVCARMGVTPTIVPEISEDRRVLVVKYFSGDFEVGHYSVCLPGTTCALTRPGDPQPFKYQVTVEVDKSLAAGFLCYHPEPHTDEEAKADAANLPD